ncbi:MAG: HAMP domain-containing histidine kinase [Deltaproteobacteria bacterium]|nr:HAMP domain-containing histidine kinase [Deltaproteobacteria bacterium]
MAQGSLKGGRQVLELARRGMVAPSSPTRWLVALRWMAIAGMGITTWVAGRLVPALDPLPLWKVLGALVAANVAWTAVAARGAGDRDALVTLQIAQDVAALTGVLWLSGGVTNPFACFLAFQIVLAGLLGTPRGMLVVTALAVAGAGLLSWAAPLNYAGAVEGAQATELLAQVVALGALGVFMGFFVFAYAQRLQAYREQATRHEKLAALGRTLGAMAHELNTPLGTIVLAGKELGHITRESGTAEAQQLAVTVVEEAQRASDIIALLRGYVRPDARVEVIDAGVFIPAWVDKELNRLSFTGERVVRAGQPAHAAVLRVALLQVLTNVLSNAVDAMRQAARPRLEVEVTDDGEQVDVSVRDNGPGIDPALLPRLGEPFQTTKEDRGGTGLGLYVSGLLAERMGARLRLESRPGEGTRVTLSLKRSGGQG